MLQLVKFNNLNTDTSQQATDFKNWMYLQPQKLESIWLLYFIDICCIVGRPVIWRFKQFRQFPINPFSRKWENTTKWSNWTLIEIEHVENIINRSLSNIFAGDVKPVGISKSDASSNFQRLEVWTCILARKRNQSKIQSLSLSCALQENQTCELILLKKLHASAFDSTSNLTSSNSWKHLPAKSWEFPKPDSFSSSTISTCKNLYLPSAERLAASSA